MSEAYIKELFEATKISVRENLPQMPPLNNLPHMEPHLLALYRETHLTTLLSLHNVSIIMQGVLLETLVKEIIYDKEGVDFEKPFGPAINHCKDHRYLDSDELEFLNKFKDTYRNNYQHENIKKITKGQQLDSWVIPIDPNNVASSLLKGIEDVKQNKAGSPQPIGYEQLRPAGYVIKQIFDKEIALKLFIEVDKFFREMLDKYLPPSR